MNDKDINGEKIISVILNSVTSYQNITYFNYWDYIIKEEKISSEIKKEINNLIEKNTNINYTNENGDSPLIVASHYYQLIDSIKILIENGANINHANQNGDTALHLAAKNGLAQIVNTLLINNANIHFINQNGDTALTIIINNSLFYDKNIKNILENIFYQEYEEYITNKAKVEIIKYRPEFSNNSLFHDIKDNILIHLNTNNSVKNIKENLILIGLKIDKKRILKIEQKIKKIFKCNINKLNTNQEKEKNDRKKLNKN
ncbi:ankyrin repeat domain-containing protein [Spiroplasma endosymbiont of Lariophagus distinguendus]|uniref:ankyrin repeat domain-containing protein n=1 Tax=Spiroplasma endosymbiont of Lariophagus distinguendus TaxID=2935082 RepID=UPI00207A80B5|nr:ankyrin repeat domain-containing protein [Spiroplasma endosymbiont of Lariophagus distinguendus]